MRYSSSIKLRVGGMRMAYNIISKEAFQVAGIRKLTEDAGGVWKLVKSNGTMEKMQAIAGEQAVRLGLCFGFDYEGYNDNMVGFMTDHKVEGYDHYAYPASKWMEILVEGKISDNVLWKTWQYVHKELIDKKVITQRKMPTIEEYEIWDEANDYCKVMIQVPIV